MPKAVNHINRDFKGLNIRRDNRGRGFNDRQWRLCTPTGEFTYFTQEEAIQGRLDYVNGVGLFNKFLLQLKPTKTTKTRRYEASREG